MSMIGEFKDFALRGNVVDMAVGIIIGGAFGKVVSSLVADVLMPPLGLFLGGVDFSDLAVKLSEAGPDGEPVLLEYGAFIQTVVDFVIVAFAIFMMIRFMNRLSKQREEPKVPTEPSDEVKLLTEIRDYLAK
ncbi:MAG: large-conductance mechanosensitive channel protein MscL [Gammaproteobacteria bacterium]